MASAFNSHYPMSRTEFSKTASASAMPFQHVSVLIGTCKQMSTVPIESRLALDPFATALHTSVYHGVISRKQTI